MVDSCTISQQVLGTSSVTGHDYDGETSFSYMGARYYNGAIGRFVSQDVWEGDLRNPQSLNKYSFAYNNPIIFVDPDGSKAEQSMMLTIASQHPAVRSLVLNDLENHARGAKDAAVVVGVAGAAMGGAVVAPRVVTPLAIGSGVTNAAYQFYVDSQDGQIDRAPSDYATDFVVGAGAGRIAEGQGFGLTALIAAGESYTSNLISGEPLDHHEAVVNVGVAVGAKGISTNAVGLVPSIENSTISNALFDTLVETAGKIAAFEVVLKKFLDDEEQE